eukprot:gene23573-28583_t
MFRFVPFGGLLFLVLTILGTKATVEGNNIFVNNASVALNRNLAWDCHRPWPDHAMYLTLFLPSRSEKETRHQWPAHLSPEYHEIFLRGAMLFYPWKVAKTPLVIMIDAEMKNSTELKEDVIDVIERGKQDFGSVFPETRVVFNDPIKKVYGTGYSRMQYLGFYADKYIKEEYILFVDSDAFFHSYVDREDLWENGKAIIQARFSERNYDVFRRKTLEALGHEEFFSCMSYFPFIIKRAHLADIREAIRQYHNTSTFDEAFASFGYEDPGSQYNIMCIWLYLHKHDEYVWKIKDQSPHWNGKHKPFQLNNANKPVTTANRSILRPEDISFSVPYLSDHCTYGSLPVDGKLVTHFKIYEHTRKVLQHLLLTSLCYLETKPPHKFQIPKNDTRTSQLSKWALAQHNAYCERHVKEHPYHGVWFRFEFYDFSQLVSEEQKKRMQLSRESRLKHCPHTYIFI